MTRTVTAFRFALALAVPVFAAAPPALADNHETATLNSSAETTMDQAEFDRIKDLIWGLELKIYSEREKGNMQFYVDNSLDSYVSWPPQFHQPLNMRGLDRERGGVSIVGGEKLALTFNDFSVEGDTALIYYTTHRTARTGGVPADEWFETIHVWVRQADDSWKLFGGMARPRPENREAIGNIPPKGENRAE